ncbi:MAG: hypothetical protein GY789_17900 [Hyphomicrobiales bacterium]|nr:hypothetical protein [Hyphomicrobiales bacterium]
MPGAHTRQTAFPPSAMRPMDGQTELAVAEAIAATGTRPERVTRLLASAFETIGDEASSAGAARGLSSGTREWLVQCAACAFRSDINWFEATCEKCGEPYDLSLDLWTATKVKTQLFDPIVTVETSIGTRAFHVPTGWHEEQFARQRQSDDSRRGFAGVCGMSDDDADEAEQFNEHDLVLIDEAIEASSPEVADQAVTTCPSCGEETSTQIDPLLFAFPRESDVLKATHLIATAYGWSQDQILRLSARHRNHLAELISRDRGPAWRTAG